VTTDRRWILVGRGKLKPAITLDILGVLHMKQEAGRKKKRIKMLMSAIFIERKADSLLI